MVEVLNIKTFFRKKISNYNIWKNFNTEHFCWWWVSENFVLWFVHLILPPNSF